MAEFKSPFLESIYRYMITRGYSKRTISTYIYWIRYYIRHHKNRHPMEMHNVEIEQFLTFLSADRKVAKATQGLALNALAFLYNKFLDKPMGNVRGFKHRVTTLAPELIPALRYQIQLVALTLEGDLVNNRYQGVWMPEALARKNPRACRTLNWQYLFPSSTLSLDPQTMLLRRHHLDESSLNKFLRKAGCQGRSQPAE